jgi:hypothetical protein
MQRNRTREPAVARQGRRRSARRPFSSSSGEVILSTLSRFVPLRAAFMITTKESPGAWLYRARQALLLESCSSSASRIEIPSCSRLSSNGQKHPLAIMYGFSYSRLDRAHFFNGKLSVTCRSTCISWSRTAVRRGAAEDRQAAVLRARARPRREGRQSASRRSGNVSARGGASP